MTARIIFRRPEIASPSGANAPHARPSASRPTRAQLLALVEAVRALGWTVTLYDADRVVLDVVGQDADAPWRVGDRLDAWTSRAQTRGPHEHEIRWSAAPWGAGVILSRRRGSASRREALMQQGLRPREIDTALALIDGGTNKELAQKLGIAPGTVRKHLERVYERLGVHDRAAAVARLHLLLARSGES